MPLWGFFLCFIGVTERRVCPCLKPDTNSAPVTVLTFQD